MWQPNLAQNRVCASNNYADQVDCFKWEAAAAEEGARRGLSCTSEGASPARKNLQTFEYKRAIC